MSEENPAGGRSFTSRRALNQLGFLAAGSAFMLASIAVTRRAIARKTIASAPKTFQPNVRQPARAGGSLQGGSTEPKPQASVDAFEALGLATLNVISFGIFAAGGVAFAFDLSSVDDLRQYARRKMYGPSGEPDEDAEKELAEWVAGVLGKAGVNVDEAVRKEKERREAEVVKEVAKEGKSRKWFWFW
ncbi:hypothetical protein VUR80DRAFT_86 [Thermomyces stellatus]